MTKSQDHWDNFIALYRAAESNDLVDQLLDFLFTPEEKANMDLRIQLVRELLQGKKTQREIAQSLRISIAKITRGSNGLKQISPELRQFLEQIL